MELNEFIAKVFKHAAAEGFEACECCYSRGESTEVMVFEQKIDNYALSTSCALGFRGLYNGKMGYSSTRILDEEAVEWLVQSARTAAELIDSDEKEFIFSGSEHYAKVESYNSALEKVTPQDMIKKAMELERDVLAQNDDIKQVNYCQCASGASEIRIVNTNGLDLAFNDNMVGALVMPVAERDGDTASGMAMRFGRDFNEINPRCIAQEAVQECAAKLGASACQSGTYDVVLRHDVMADMLQTFSSMFSADTAQKGFSLLKDREGDKIASEVITIVDDPLMKCGMSSQPFDAEGVATYTKNVVENGVLCTLLHNLKTANKQGVESTGNASRASVGAPVSVSPTNFYVKPGEYSLDELLAELDDGLLITEVAGLHAGANSITGDFSLGANGYIIENGKKAQPVKNITIAGNFLKLLESVQTLGSDLWFSFPSGTTVGAPSALIRRISVAGE